MIKKTRGMLMGAGIGLVMVASTFAALPKTADEHLALAASYEGKASEQASLVAEHQQMKKAGVTEKTPMAERQTMDKHCDAIIKGAQKLQADLQAFAQFHKARAEELKAQ